MSKQRLDTLLVDRNLCPSRQLAQRWIRAGEVRVNQQLVDKPGTQVATDAEISLKARSRNPSWSVRQQTMTNDAKR